MPQIVDTANEPDASNQNTERAYFDQLVATVESYAPDEQADFRRWRSDVYLWLSTVGHCHDRTSSHHRA
jgi:hypothetical protein